MCAFGCARISTKSKQRRPTQVRLFSFHFHFFSLTTNSAIEILTLFHVLTEMQLESLFLSLCSRRMLNAVVVVLICLICCPKRTEAKHGAFSYALEKEETRHTP